MLSTRLLFIVIGCLPPWLVAAEEVPEQPAAPVAGTSVSPQRWLRSNKQLRYPAADAIPQEPWQAALGGAVGNGIATLLARQQAEGNSTGLMVPPIETRKIESYQTKSIPHARKLVKEPIFEMREVQQLVPKRDANGYVVGTEVKTVKVPGKVTGYKEVEKLVPDKDGTVMVDMRFPVYAAGGPALFAKGTFGFNGIALHVLARAGMAALPAAAKQAETLEDLLGAVGLPDTTFDLAWLAIGLAQMPATDERRALVLRLASKLIDGQIRDGAAAGLWGPVSINAPQLAVCLEQYYRLDAEIAKLDVQLGTANRAAAQRLQPERNKLSSQRSAVQSLMRESASQGHRLTSITKPWNPDGEPNAPDATRELAGLAYYPYNRQIGDIEDTALALMALAELQRQGQLPAAPRRVALDGRKTIAAPTTASGIALAAKAVVMAQLADGSWTATCISQTSHLFDQVKAVQIPDVPCVTEHPALLSPRTVQTSLAGAAALRALQRLDPGTVKAEQIAKAEAIVVQGMAVWTGCEALSKERLRWFISLDIDTATLQARKGWLLAPPEIPVKGAKARPVAAPADPLASIGADLPVDKMALAGAGAPSVLAPYLMPWQQPAGWQIATFRQLSYRLIATQSEHGQWNTAAGNPSLNTADVALVMEQDALQFMRVLDKRGGLQDPAVKPGKKERPAKAGAEATGPHLRTPTFERSSTCSSEAASTVMNLAVLVDGLQGPLSMEGIEILPPLPADAAPGTMRSPDLAATAVARPNAALIDLLRAMGAVSPTGAVSTEPEPAVDQPAEPEPAAER
jgi:hypothetical protein